MLRLLRFVVALLFGGIVGVAAGAGDERVAVPAAADLQRARGTVVDVFKSDLAEARRPEQKGPLASNLLKAGIDEKDDRASQYVLLTMACDMAAGAGDLKTTTAAIERLDQTFTVDALALKAAAAVQLSKSIQPAGAKDLIPWVGQIVSAAMAADRYAIARQAVDQNLSLGKKFNDPIVAADAGQLSKDLAVIELAFRDASKAQRTLDNSPDDADANFKVGRFKCFYKGDWKGGLPLLTRGSDPSLAKQAKRDLDPTAAGPSDRAAAADGWWDLADKQPTLVRTNILTRAAILYTDASPKLNGLLKLKVEKRLKELAEQHIGPGAATPQFAGVYRIICKSGDLALSVSGADMSPGEPIIVWILSNHDEQLWTLQAAKRGYKIVSKHSNLALGVREGSKEPHKEIIQDTPHDGPDQVWTIKPHTDPRFVTIVNQNSGLCLTSAGDGAILFQEPRQKADAQLWRLEPKTP